MNEPQTFSEYYKYYLTLHQHPVSRRLHAMGQLVTLMTLVYAITTQTWMLLLAVPVIVYPFAWSGHFFFEKNTPASFSRPLWAKACDWVMLKDMLIGKIPL